MSDACTRPLEITGVDKFEDAPCDDWPDKSIKSWSEAGFGVAPTVETAQRNIASRLPAHHKFELVCSDEMAWLPTVRGTFDLAYLDTSHDEAHVTKQIQAVRHLCGPNTLLAGDDYENIQPTWGVKDAVSKAFKEHHVLADSIWWADARDLK